MQTQMNNATKRPNGDAANVLIALIRKYNIYSIPRIHVLLKVLTYGIGMRVIQHNVRVMAEYYSSVDSARMASMLQMRDRDELEAVLSEMASEGSVSPSGGVKK